ncbi:uncharacterized protein [Rutidosis leptorrhynchoides]|uniref:uncharacterized protein n=1 Tax=Rutidosis leptorrhynchoides TaxID=125765 RepID=UPI003A98D3F3
MELDTYGCPTCDCIVEDVEHTFFSCPLARDIWRRVRLWLDVDFIDFNLWNGWLCWFENWVASAQFKNRTYAIVATLVWVLWRYRNGVIFSVTPTKKEELFDSIRSFSFAWISSRSKDNIT